MNTRLSKEDWLDFGLKALAKDGPEILKANILAKALGVSRGSFYWHFEDIDAFHTALIAHWQRQTTDEVINALPLGTPQDRLSALMGKAMRSDDGLESAMRRWTRSQPVIAASDGARIAHLIALLRECGLGDADAEARAHFLYWANIGRIMSGAPSDAVSQDAVMRILHLLQK